MHAGATAPVDVGICRLRPPTASRNRLGVGESVRETARIKVGITMADHLFIDGTFRIGCRPCDWPARTGKWRTGAATATGPAARRQGRQWREQQAGADHAAEHRQVDVTELAGGMPSLVEATDDVAERGRTDDNGRPTAAAVAIDRLTGTRSS